MINGAAISTDYERAVIIFKRLIAAFSEKKIPWLCQENLPEEQCLPPSIQRGSREHSCFLWFAAPLMRGKIKSDDVLKRVGMLYEKEPSLFLPEKAAAFSDVVVTAYLKSGGIKYKAEEFGASWVKNAAGLENYGWDPIKPFYDARRYRDIWTVLKIKDIFAGWREKILSLLTLWYEEVGFVGPLYGPPALDIQKLRLLFATSILRPETNAVDVEKSIKIALPFLERVCEENKFFTPHLDGAMWLLGRNGCKVQPQRCHYCPVETYCSSFVPAGPYYKYGKIKIEPRRQLCFNFSSPET